MPFGMVSGVGRGMGVLDGVVIVEGEGAVLGYAIVTSYTKLEVHNVPQRRHAEED